MFDVYTIAALVDWKSLDKMMYDKYVHREISEADYMKYIDSKETVLKLMGVGDIHLDEKEVRTLVEFLSKMLSSKEQIVEVKFYN